MELLPDHLGIGSGLDGAGHDPVGGDADPGGTGLPQELAPVRILRRGPQSIAPKVPHAPDAAGQGPQEQVEDGEHLEIEPHPGQVAHPPMRPGSAHQPHAHKHPQGQVDGQQNRDDPRDQGPGQNLLKQPVMKKLEAENEDGEGEE